MTNDSSRFGVLYLNASMNHGTSGNFITGKSNESLSLCHPILPNSSISYCPYTQDQINEAMLVLYCVYPILLFICTVGNVVNLIVLLKEKPKGPTNVYMTTVAVADLFVLWLYLPLYLANLSVTLHSKSTLLYNYKTYHEYEGIRVWGRETAMMTGDWTLIIFSLARLLAVIRPFSFRSLQTATAARIASVVLLCLAGLFTLSNIVEYYYRKYPYLASTAAKNRPQWLKNWYETLQQEAEVAMTIFKFVALLVINLIMVAAIKRQQNANIGKLKAGQRSNSDRKYRNSNILLLCCVAVYLVTQLPWLVMNCLNNAEDYFGSTAAHVPSDVRKYASPFLTLCQMTNYSVNFIMYVTFSKRFRAQFLLIFAPKVCLDRLRIRRQSTVVKSSDDHDRNTDSSGRVNDLPLAARGRISTVTLK